MEPRQTLCRFRTLFARKMRLQTSKRYRWVMSPVKDTLCTWISANFVLYPFKWAPGRNYVTNRCYKYRRYPIHTMKLFMITTGVTPTVVVCSHSSILRLVLTFFTQDISPGNLYWSFAPGAIRTTQDSDPQDLGTCKASKAAGTKFGASKNLGVNILKVGPTILDHLWAIGMIASQLASRTGMAVRRNAIIVWTLRYHGRVLTPAELVTDPLWSSFISLINIIHQQNGLIVVPAGDDGSHTPVTKLPAVLRTALQIPLVVVGGVNYLGYQEPYSQDLSEQSPQEHLLPRNFSMSWVSMCC